MEYSECRKHIMLRISFIFVHRYEVIRSEMSCLSDVEVDGLDFTNVVAFGKIFHSLTTCQLQYWLFLYPGGLPLFLWR